MSGKKGMEHKKYTAEFKAKVVQQIKSGDLNIRGDSRESGITRCTIPF
jgi:transposase-like protein